MNDKTILMFAVMWDSGNYDSLEGKYQDRKYTLDLIIDNLGLNHLCLNHLDGRRSILRMGYKELNPEISTDEHAKYFKKNYGGEIYAWDGSSRRTLSYEKQNRERARELITKEKFTLD